MKKYTILISEQEKESQREIETIVLKRSKRKFKAENNSN